MWRKTVEHLLANWRQFDGRKVVSIATDQCCDDADGVIEAFGDVAGEIEFIERENIKPLQEVASFVPMMERVIDEPGITLYCHAKGCTHHDPRSPSHKWRDAMAAACLEYPELVDCAFEDGANICGAFRSHGLWAFPGYHNWHFAGTWFWFRNARALELEWRNVHQSFEGVEAWPGIFPVDESCCLFFDNANTAHLYWLSFWRENVTSALAYWRKSLSAVGLTPLAENDRTRCPRIDAEAPV